MKKSLLGFVKEVLISFLEPLGSEDTTLCSFIGLNTVNFQRERDIFYFNLNSIISCLYFLRGSSINEFLRLGLRVGCPFVGQDLNVTDGRPPEVFP